MTASAISLTSFSFASTLAYSASFSYERWSYGPLGVNRIQSVLASLSGVQDHGLPGATILRVTLARQA